MLIDVRKCIGCYNCVLACKDEHCGNEYPGYSAAQPMTGHFWIKIIERERGVYPKVKMSFIPVLCMHCENASCVKMAKDGAVYRRPDGIILIDPEKAKLRKEILNSCPYRVIYWNDEKNIPQKCTFCAHLLDQGFLEPRCVEACPTDALIFGNLDDPTSKVSQKILSSDIEALRPGYGLMEKVVYTGLPKKFVAGTVIYGDTGECAENIPVNLICNGECRIGRTNVFGDFEFEGLPDNSKCSIEITAPGYNSYKIEVITRTDIYLGRIMLQPSEQV